MKIPNKVIIKNKIYSIVYDKEALRDDSIYGRTYHTKLQIILDQTQPKDQRENTFFHELLHAIIDCSPLRVDLKDSALQEKVAVGISEDLLLVLRVNKIDVLK